MLIIYGALLLLGLAGLLLLPQLIRAARPNGVFAMDGRIGDDARRVIFGPGVCYFAHRVRHSCTHHPYRLVAWTSAGVDPAAFDAAVLFVVVIGVALVPISINGWGLRELAVVALLGRYGVAPEQALVFSVCFGLVLAAGSLPGARHGSCIRLRRRSSPSSARDEHKRAPRTSNRRRRLFNDGIHARPYE